ncbi:MAG: hypothetical protein V1928_05625 [Parcubacteria group bacterium]
MFDSKKIQTIAKVSLFAFMLLFVALPVLAQTLDVGIDQVGAATGLGKQDIRQTIGQIINVALGFLGVIAVVVVLVGGFKYMVAGGNTEKVKEAQKWIISGIIGLAIILSAYAISRYVISSLLKATTGTGLSE